MSAASAGSLEQRQLERLLDVGRGLVSELDQERVLRQVLEAARELTDARYAALGVLDGAKRELERFLFVGIDVETRAKIGPLPRGHGILGELIRDPKPLRLAAIADHPRSYGFPANHPPMTTFLGVPVMIRGEVYGNLYLTEKEGGAEFDERDENLLVVLADWAAIAIANARLYEQAEHRRDELERVVRGLEATASLSKEVGGLTDVRRVFELVVKRGRALVNARACILLLAERDSLVVADAAGEVPRGLRGRLVPISGSRLGDVLRRGATEHLSRAERGAWAPLEIEASTALVSPLRSRGRDTGVLVAFDRRRNPPFTADEELLLASFAATAANAVADIRAIETQKRELSIAASEQERRRWARELHDETLQELGAVKMMQESALNLDRPEVVTDALEQAVAQIENVITGLERLITELRPAALDELGTQAAVQALVEQVISRSDLDIDLDIDLAWERGDASERHTPELETVVYRIVQEALANVVKHADAGHARVSIVEDEHAVTVTVQDDGSGIQAGSGRHGFGLVGMRERVELVGGELEIGAARNGGTRVRATLPVARRGSPARQIAGEPEVS
ncbi:MAG TPA: GAF domain-containing protein [Solirubrobacterales bacterium]|jgi:signal transduction histidine kinase|nr:GAF domain-containing protein [Solirubrobacterales bacterium]